MEEPKTCKTCHAALSSDSLYCNSCGARVMTDRITFKGILRDFVVGTFSWDNLFFYTLKCLILRPGLILREYLSGVRMKYSNPFGFLAIPAAIGLIVFNIFADEYMAQANQIHDMELSVFEPLARKTLESKGKDSVEIEAELARSTLEQKELMMNIQKRLLQYYNLLVFIMMPLYGFIAFKTYGKPYNYGEHLVINAYLQGLLMLSSLLLFSIDLLTGLSTMMYGVFIGMAYYLYAYGQLYRQNAEGILVSFLRFIAVLVITGVILLVVLPVVGYILGYLIGSVLRLLVGAR